MGCMWGMPRPLHLRRAPREVERRVVHLRGYRVALERRLVLQSRLEQLGGNRSARFSWCTPVAVGNCTAAIAWERLETTDL
eukprot:scaffold23984_cov57-Phaeocystis_antarctica.AAC.2